MAWSAQRLPSLEQCLHDRALREPSSSALGEQGHCDTNRYIRCAAVHQLLQDVAGGRVLHPCYYFPESLVCKQVCGLKRSNLLTIAHDRRLHLSCQLWSDNVHHLVERYLHGLEEFYSIIENQSDLLCLRQ